MTSSKLVDFTFLLSESNKYVDIKTSCSLSYCNKNLYRCAKENMYDKLIIYFGNDWRLIQKSIFKNNNYKYHYDFFEKYNSKINWVNVFSDKIKILDESFIRKFDHNIDWRFFLGVNENLVNNLLEITMIR